MSYMTPPQFEQPTVVGEIGTLALLTLVGGGITDPGVTIAGSSLRYANCASDVNYIGYAGAMNQSPPGSWRCLGNTGYYINGSYSTNATNNLWATTLWIRIA